MASLGNRMKLSWSVTKPCQAEELSTGTQNFCAQFRLGQDEKSDSSRISKDISNPWARSLGQILLQFKQNLCFHSSFLLAEVVPRLLGSGDRRGRSEGEFVAWITPVLDKPSHPSNTFSPIIFHEGWSQHRKVLSSSLLTSTPPFPEFPSSPRAPCL